MSHNLQTKAETEAERTVRHQVSQRLKTIAPLTRKQTAIYKALTPEQMLGGR